MSPVASSLRIASACYRLNISRAYRSDGVSDGTVILPEMQGRKLLPVTVVWIFVEIIPPRLKEPLYRVYELRLRQGLAASKSDLAPPHRGAVRREPAVGAQRGLRRRQLRLPDGCGQDRRDAAVVPGSRHRNDHRLPAVHRKPAARSRRARRAHRDHHRRRRGDLRTGQPLECAHRRGSGTARRGTGPPAARRGGIHARHVAPFHVNVAVGYGGRRRSSTRCARC